MHDIDLDLLRCFVEVAKTESFTVAGEKLGRSQSAVSMRVKKLEEYFGKSLLKRTSRHVALTADGLKLLPMAKSLLAEGETLFTQMTKPLLRGELRLGLLEYIAPHRVSDIIDAIKTHLPDAQLSFRIGLSSQLKQELHDNQLDIALTVFDHADEDAIYLVEDELVWIASEDQTNVNIEPMRLCLMKAPCFYREKALLACKHASVAVDEITTNSSVLSLREMVSAGLGVSLLGKSALGKGLRIVPASELGINAQRQSIPIGLIGTHPHKQQLANLLTNILTRDFV